MAFEAELPVRPAVPRRRGVASSRVTSPPGRALYRPGDLRRADAFQIFYIAINAGVIAAPLIAGTLGEVYGWH